MVAENEASKLASSVKYFDDNLENQEKERLIKDFLRLAVYTEASRKELTKDLVFQKVFKRDHNRAFLAVLHYVQIRLKDLLGMELVQTTIREKGKGQASTKLKDAYILRSIPELLGDEQCEWTDEEETWMPLLVLILSLILGSSRSMPFDVLKDFLGKLEVDVEAKSEEFGDMKDLFALWYRQGYLVKIAAQGQTPEQIVWGPRSKITFTEEKIAAFMVKMFGDDVSVSKAQQLKTSILSEE